MPEGTVLENTPLPFVDPGLNAVTVVNHVVNYGWEYVWHCHILSHEEMDMMHSMLLGVAPRVPLTPTATLSGSGATRQVIVRWVDDSLNETGFTIQRSPNISFTTAIATYNVPANTTVYSDTIGTSTQLYYYRVAAINTFGDTYVYPAPAVGFPNQTMNSGYTAGATFGSPQPPTAPTNLTATVQSGTRINVTWSASPLATSYVLTRTGGTTTVAAVTLNGVANTSYLDTRSINAGVLYTYTLVAVNGSSLPALSSAPVSVSLVVPLRAPTNLRLLSRQRQSVSMGWSGTTGASYQVWRKLGDAQSGNLYTLVATTAVNTTNYNNTGLSPNTTYTWYVVATMNGLTSGPSSVLTVTTLP